MEVCNHNESINNNATATTAQPQSVEDENESENKSCHENENENTTNTTPPIVSNPMNNLNPMMMPPMMSGFNPSTMMPGFTPYPMFGAPSMLPFMPGLNPNPINPLTNTHTNANKTKTGKRCGDWQSYITEKGKTYYFNVMTKVNTWDKPKEWIDDEAPIGETRLETVSRVSKQESKSKKEGYLGTGATKELAVIKDNVAKRSFGDMHTSKYKDRSERVGAFRELLADKSIFADWNWKKVLPKIVTDSRYNALPKLDDKKNELLLWQQDEKKRIEDEERERRYQLKAGYFELLDEFMEKIIRKEYRKAKHYLESDNRFVLIESKHRREEWFDEWQSVRYKEYKKEKKKKKESALKEFTERLGSCDLVQIGAEWMDIRDKLAFGSEGFMEEVSDRSQQKIFNEIMCDLMEKEREEKRRKSKEDRKRFSELMDELIANKSIHTKCRYDDDAVIALMVNDERYLAMKMHAQNNDKIKSIFNDKLQYLRDELLEDKKIFKPFIRMKEKEFVILEHDRLSDILVKFDEMMKGDETETENSEIASINRDHLEHLLCGYMFKKQKEIKNNLKINAKKRDRSAADLNDGEDEDEPHKKRQKIDKYVDVTIHDPNTDKGNDENKENKENKEMDEGEIEELEEGELSDVDMTVIKNNDKENELETDDGKNNNNAHDKEQLSSFSDCSGSNGSRSRSRSSSVGDRSSSNCSFNSAGSNDSNSNHRKLSKKSRHKKNGKRNRSHRNHRKYDRRTDRTERHHREDKKHREHHHHKDNKKGKKHRERKRERTQHRESQRNRDCNNTNNTNNSNNIDHILYGIGSDFDEDDLYYRGDIKRSDPMYDDDDLNMTLDDIHRKNVHAHARSSRGRNHHNHWRRNNQRQHQHHDLDYNNYSLNDHEINADSYNLDNEEITRWNE